MAYLPPITIKDTIENIKKRCYVLPSIQREFVWNTNQIETLFDSLMRDYPISTFLFWKVDKNKIKDFQFYEFLKKYHQKNSRHNRKAELSDSEDVTAILDGQQRMTSLYLALTGSYAKKAPYLHKANMNAYPEKKLYLNLLKPSDDLETEYDFRFLTDEEAVTTENNFWFECGKILEMAESGMMHTYIIENEFMNTSIYKKDQSLFATKALDKFRTIVHLQGTINYYEEKSEELDKVLQIFIRTNSGGTKLSYSDLLLSIATAQWKEKDAREVIHEFVDDINKIGSGFSFNKDFVLKSCLVLADFDVKFKVDNFTKNNMATIENNWERASLSMRTSIELVAMFGYNDKNLIAKNALIPIAYFIYKNKIENKIIYSSQYENDRKLIKEWLARVLLKGVFGGQPDSVYPKMRTLIKANIGRFPLNEIIASYKGNKKSISFTEDEIENLLDHEYGHEKTYCILTLLYDGLNNNFNYHQDHIHPRSLFKNHNLKKLELSGDKFSLYNNEMNKIANIQLLQSTQNIEKSDEPFITWVEKKFPIQAERNTFLMQNHIALEQSLEFEAFPEFISNRRRILKKHLINILNVSNPDLIADIMS